MSIFSSGRRKIKVLIFAFPRTGSTTLAEALGLFWRVEKILEPFNKTHGYAHDRVVEDKESLDRVLGEISGMGVDVLKHLNCQLSEELNHHLLEHGFRHILYLWRRNALKRAVSNEISFQAREWRRDRDKVLSTEFVPLDLEKIRGNINWYRSEVERYRDFMRTSGIDFTEIVMEDFYDSGMEEKERYILRLGRKCFPLRSLRCNREELRKILSPEVSRLNSPETYRLIPNIDEVDREFSCEENGYLFE